MSEFIEQFDISYQESHTTIEDNQCDRLLLFSVICLLIFGILMVYSSTSVVTPTGKEALQSGNIVSPFSYLKRHVMSLSIGTLFMVLAYRLNLRKLHSLSLYLLILSVLVILLVFVPEIGLSINGARRWIRFWPSTFQPSELGKFAMVVFLARYISSSRFNPRSLASFIKPLIIMVIFQVLFLLQPDFGAAMVMALITFTMLFLSGARKRYLLLSFLVSLPFVAKLLLVPYRLKRILAFLDPWSDQQGAGYQLVQSFIALGSGGLAGIGLGESKQKLSYLPYINTDFIFSLMGEELGFIGVSVVMILFGIIFIRGMRIASRKRETFHYYLGQGLTYFIIYQMLINTAVVTGLLPTKGLPLPFVSYGGSALFVNMTAIGLLLNLSKRYQPITESNHAYDFLQRKKAKIAVYGRVQNQRRKK